MNIARIRCFGSSQDLEKLVHAFITSRVDYCNGLLTGRPKKTIRQLQLTQNAAARIANGLGPKYIADMLTEYKPNRPLRSLGSSQLEIPRVHTKQGESAFKTWATFKSRLKTHLFSHAFTEWALCYDRTDCIVFYV